MIFEFIATITAGFGFAGIALIICHIARLLKKESPKWLIPVCAGVGMLSFQIHQEYHWFEQTAKTLPANTQVVKKIETSAWYRPWSYVKPQVIRFMAVQKYKKINQHSYLVTLYFFERRISTKAIAQLIDCKQQARADYPSTTKKIDISKAQWVTLTKDDPLLQIVCK